MEQKTLVAIILSAAVLFGYDSFFVAPKRAQMVKEAKVIKTTELATNITSQSSKDTKHAPTNQKETTSVNIKEENSEIKSTEFKIELSNVGGSLHNIALHQKRNFPLDHIITLNGFESAEFKTIVSESDKVVSVFENPEWTLIKTVKVIDNNLLNIRMEINPRKTSSILKDPEFILFSIDNASIDPKEQREKSLDEYSYLLNNKVVRKGNAFKFSPKENKIVSGNIEWAGFRNHFSTVVIKPEFKSKIIEINTVTEEVLNILVTPEEKSSAYEFSCYIGPQDTRLTGQYKKNFDKIVVFSNYWILEVFAKAIFYTIPFLYSIFKSWGLSIILISLLIYGLTYPLTIKSMMSMRKMQEVQPKIKALQERFKSDPKKLNAEIMDIYKREKINPLGGCLPFLLQMPIFVALYQVLWRSYYFQGKSFLWIKDLAKPDQLITFPFSLPFIGNEFNILPLLMAGVMFLQQKISAKNMVVADEQQAMQQKMMMYFFPVFIGFIFYHFASGLSLYFTVFYSLSTLTQWKMSKMK